MEKNMMKCLAAAAEALKELELLAFWVELREEADAEKDELEVDALYTAGQVYDGTVMILKNKEGKSIPAFFFDKEVFNEF